MVPALPDADIDEIVSAEFVDVAQIGQSFMKHRWDKMRNRPAKKPHARTVRVVCNDIGARLCPSLSLWSRLTTQYILAWVQVLAFSSWDWRQLKPIIHETSMGQDAQSTAKKPHVRTVRVVCNDIGARFFASLSLCVDLLTVYCILALSAKFRFFFVGLPTTEDNRP